MANPETLPGFSDRELLEGMTADQIVDEILRQGEKVSEVERYMNLASDVLEGAYGLTVDQVLQERDKNGETKAASS
jgi:hypothetical protein